MSGPASHHIAIVGMAGRFPGAADLRAFWRNLREGVESIAFYSEAELRAAGVEDEALRDADFVPAFGAVEGIEEFDAPFFGYTPGEARLLDPQQRLFLQAAWTALEDAGYSTEHYDGSIGVYAGSGLNSYLLENLCAGSPPGRVVEDLPTLLGSDKDFLATRVSYHLDLKGPSIVVQSGCSTSLVAVVQAVQALEGHQCDMALAGGVTIRVPQRRGYRYVREGILSPDGHCRAFDARAAGTVFGNGLGVVVLKRLADALADGDHIRAVLRGAAVNNDGANKIGYTAPSVDRQTEVIALAQALAGVDPDTIGYVEAHGTGTALGDPVEFAALTQAFRAGTERKGYCALGTVKTNVGHLDAASGAAGLIKTVLALEHRQLPPSLHFEAPNPAIDFAASPFFVNTELREWTAEDRPRRAGVSSFGIGGTNAHVVLEEAPEPAGDGAARSDQLLLLSARTLEALETATASLAAHLEADPGLSLADVAWTLQVGRRAFEHRRALVCRDAGDAVQRLRAPRTVPSSRRTAGAPSVGFRQSGSIPVPHAVWQGLHASEPFFREQLERCLDLLRPHVDHELRTALFPAGDDVSSVELPPSLAEPARFAVLYALSRLFMEWGVHPDTLLCGGVAELVAACLTQVFRLENGLALAALRGRWLENGDDATLAAFHDEASRAPRKPPELAFASSVTGTWIRPGEALDPDYWLRWLQHPAPSGESPDVPLMESGRIHLEIGHGGPVTDPELTVLSIHPGDDPARAQCALLEAVARLWLAGVDIDWKAFHAGARRRRVPLPTYPFARQRHWFEPSPASTPAPAAAGRRSADPDDWIHLPVWRRVPPAPPAAQGANGTRWLVLCDDRERWQPLLARLRARDREVTLVLPGDGYEAADDGSFRIDPTRLADYRRLVFELGLDGAPVRVAHLWLASPGVLAPAAVLARGFESLHHLTTSVTEVESEIHATVVTTGVCDVAGDRLDPPRATVLGACRVLPQERPGVELRCVDVDVEATLAEERLLARLENELVHADDAAVVALRGGHRWLPGFERAGPLAPLPHDELQPGGVWLITGGLGGIGLILARDLAEHARARLVLVGRSGLPPRERWNEVASEPDAERSEAVLAVQGLEARGAEVLVLAADVADRSAMERVFSTLRARFGALHGIIHAAGVPGRGVLQVADAPPPTEALRAKLDGTLLLAELAGDEPQHFLLCSAVSTVLGGLGQADYVAGNAFLDAFATASDGRPGPRVVSVGWDTWREVGMAVEAEVPASMRARKQAVLASGLVSSEGCEVFRRVLAGPHAHVLVSTTPLEERARGLAEPSAAAPAEAAAPVAVSSTQPAPAPAPVATERAGTTAAGPAGEVERSVLAVWKQLLGLEHAELDDSFFEQGGNSLLATQMLARLAKEFPGSDLSLRGLFDQPTARGLVDAILATRGEGPSAPAEIAVAPFARDTVQETVVQAWTQLLGLEHGEPGDSFFEQGGNSLLATQMLARLSKEFPGARLSLRGLFDRPTLGGLVETIRESQGTVANGDERPLRERARTSAGDERKTLLADWLRERVAEAVQLPVAELPADGDLNALDQTLIAGHLASSLRGDLELAVYPTEVRQRPSIAGLVDFVSGELDRLQGLLVDGDAPAASEVDPRSFRVPLEAKERPRPAERNPSMAFVLSAPRSGSTLLRLMLSAHPRLFCPPELFLLDNEGMRGWHDDPFHGFYFDGLVRAFMAVRGLSHDEASTFVDELVARDAPVHEVYRLLQDQAALLVDKTPTYALSSFTLQRAEELFDRPRYVGLVRHPFAVVESIVRNRLDRIRRVEGNSYALAERYWVEACKNTFALGDEVGEERLRVQRYEDLVRDPDRELRGLCGFLGVAFDEAVLDPYGKGVMFGGPGDPNLFARGKVEPNLADAWRTIRLPRPLGAEASELAERLGYELPR